MLKKLLRNVDQSLDKSVFPLHSGKVEAGAAGADEASKNIAPKINLSLGQLQELAIILAENSALHKQLMQEIAPRILESLLAEYNFVPTSKYLEDIENKKK